MARQAAGCRAPMIAPAWPAGADAAFSGAGAPAGGEGVGHAGAGGSVWVGDPRSLRVSAYTVLYDSTQPIGYYPFFQLLRRPKKHKTRSGNAVSSLLAAISSIRPPFCAQLMAQGGVWEIGAVTAI